MTVIAKYLLSLLLGAIANAVASFFTYNEGKKAGENKEKLKNAEEQLESINEANTIRDKLKSDTTYADRVRKRFTR